MTFLDETKFNCFCSHGCSLCWASPFTSLNLQMVKLIIKHGGGSMMVWGCLIAIGPSLICKIYDRKNQFVYCEILESKMLGIFAKLSLNPTRIIFQYDNDPKHIAKIVKEWLLNQPFSLMKWPLKSQELNPI